MKKISILILFGISSLAFAQTFEQKSAEKSCNCLKELNKDTVTKEDINKCSAEGISETLKELPEKEAKRKMKNMVAAVQMLNEVRAMILSGCVKEKTETPTEN